MSARNGVYETDEDDPHFPCEKCGDDYPGSVLEDGLCPVCVDDGEDDQ